MVAPDRGESTIHRRILVSTVDEQAYNGSRPRVALKANLGQFLLEFPTRELPMNAPIQAGFDQDLNQFFSPVTSVVEANDDEWAEVIHGGETRSTSQAASPPTLTVRDALRARELPVVESLRRPTELFKNTTPYILRVDARTSPLLVECSHQPSLDILVSYLKRWSKENMHDSLKV